jgi:phosphate transport system substrate-binding protein
MEGTPTESADTRVTRRGFLAASGAAAVGLAGCVVHGEDSGLRGTILIDGSDTVLPQSAAIVEEFLLWNNRVNIPVSGSGTGAGFRRFTQGLTDVQNASRPITPEEHEQCVANGVEYVELKALRDGIAVFTNPDNDWCECLTVDQLSAMWEQGSEVERWSDLDPEWPDEEIEFFGRGPASGTFDTFTERINGERGDIRDDYSATSDTNVIVRGVSGDQHAIGWGGAGYYFENEDDLNLVGIDDGNGCVEPNRETIEQETYTPLTRWMYVYLNANELDREVMQAFARFYFQEVDDETHAQAVENGFGAVDERLTWTQWAARKVGYYAASDAVVAESEQALEAAIQQATGRQANAIEQSGGMGS